MKDVFWQEGPKPTGAGFAKVSPRKSPLTRSTIEPDELREQLRGFFATDRIHIEDDSEAPFSTWSNQEKMLHKISVCHGMARNSGVSYDLIRGEWSLSRDLEVNYMMMAVRRQ